MEGRGARFLRALGAVSYWLAVLAISLAFVIGLVLFFESRDRSSVDGADGDPSSEPEDRPRAGDDAPGDRE